MCFRDRLLDEFPIVFFMDFGPKMTPKNIHADHTFAPFFELVPQGVHLKVPWLILDPFRFHFGRF